MKQFLTSLYIASFAFSTWATDIPNRPEKLKFPSLKYDPPTGSDYRIQLQSGPVAYLVPNGELPLVNISIRVRTGSFETPPGKEGLAELTGSLLTAGAGSRSAEDLEERLAFLAARLGASVSSTQGSVSMNLLTKDLKEGLEILREVLTMPKFQQDRIDLSKKQVIQAMKQRNDDSRGIERRERVNLLFGENFWRARMSSKASIDSITRKDLQAFHRAWFHPANFVVAASGDFDRDEMRAELESLFSDWPFKGKKASGIPIDGRVFAKPGVYIVNKEVNQGRVSILLPGIQRDNSDYYAIQVMNDILGGGGFTSRITNRVRSDEGLAYSAGSSFPGGTYYPMAFFAGFQSKSRTVLYAVSIVFEEMKRIATQPVTDEEMKTAKNSFIQTFPESFATKGQIAGIFLNEEYTGRAKDNPDYYKNYRSKIATVTKADVQRVARKYLNPEKAVVLIVGDKKTILKGHPNHPVSLKNLTSGELIDIPLRDPFTLEPIK
ncbi:MAG: pitrilysin family protein [Verrucomicrobiota bacterium]|jgi:predicted Zn-dependent peptidase|nr:pitrilysin family protein [Verrucomicrobiota bacterium]